MKKRVRKYLIPHEENEFRPHLLRVGGILAILLFVFVAVFTSNIQRIVLKTSDYIASILPSVLVDLTNSDRATLSINTLKLNPKLEKAAELKANDMASKSYFAHYSPEGVSPWHWVKEAGYDFVYAGENLAVNFDDSLAVNNAWMASPGHRANLLNSKFTEVGIATARGVYNGRETMFVVQMFGSPALAAASVAKIFPQNTDVMAITAQNKTVSQTESNLVPIESSNVLGETESQFFISVKDTNAVPLKNSSVDTGVRPSYSNFFERFLSSPTKVLGLLYTLLAVVLLIMLYFAQKIKHAHKSRHTVLIIAILIIIFGIFSFYQTRLQKNVELPQTQKSRIY